MADLSFLAPPQRIHVIWSTTNGANAAFAGHLRGVAADRLSIEVNGYDLHPDAPHAGQRVHVRVPHLTGLYDIPSRVVDEQLVGGMIVAVAGEVERLERRMFPRVPVDMLPMTAFRLGRSIAPPRPFAVRVIDLSEGGAKLETHEFIEQTERVQLVLRFDDEPPILTTLTVLESTPLAPTNGRDERAARFRVRGTFARLPEGNRLRLARFIQRQRERD